MRRKRESGTTMLEAALVLPVVVVLLCGVIDWGYVFSSQLELRSASREGARVAAVDNGCAPNGCSNPTSERDQIIFLTRSRAQGLAAGSTITVNVFCSTDPCSNAAVGVDTVTVCLSYTMSSLSGVLSPIIDGSVLTSKAVMRLEQKPTFVKGSDRPAGGPPPCT